MVPACCPAAQLHQHFFATWMCLLFIKLSGAGWLFYKLTTRKMDPVNTKHPCLICSLIVILNSSCPADPGLLSVWSHQSPALPLVFYCTRLPTRQLTAFFNELLMPFHIWHGSCKKSSGILCGAVCWVSLIFFFNRNGLLWTMNGCYEWWMVDYWLIIISNTMFIRSIQSADCLLLFYSLQIHFYHFNYWLVSDFITSIYFLLLSALRTPAFNDEFNCLCCEWWM